MSMELNPRKTLLRLSGRFCETIPTTSKPICPYCTRLTFVGGRRRYGTISAGYVRTRTEGVENWIVIDRASAGTAALSGLLYAIVPGKDMLRAYVDGRREPSRSCRQSLLDALARLQMDVKRGRRSCEPSPLQFICLLVEEAAHLAASARMFELAQGLRLDLTNAFARHGELLADLFQRVIGVHADAEAHAQHTFLTRG